ncbi:MAG: TAXI family TRAP transporter solute-binding subunit [Beijerinckiaceae bacterium]
MKAMTVACAAALAAAFSVPAALAQTKITGVYSIATLGPGTTLNATSAGMAKLFNANSSARMRLREAGGFLEVLVGRGETQFAIGTTPGGYDAYAGVGVYPNRPVKNLRTATLGPVLYGSLLVQTASGARYVEDLKGKKIPSSFPGSPLFLVDINVLFSGGGLTWKDVTAVPMSGIRENYQAFLDGVTDAANASVGTGFINQANAKHRGVRFIGMRPVPDLAARLQKVKPGYYPALLKAGYATGIAEDTTVWAKDIAIMTSSRVPDEVVYTLVKIVWEHVRELDSVHPAMKTWTQEGMARANNTSPMHAGAVRFFKQVSKWTPDREALQKQLLAVHK